MIEGLVRSLGLGLIFGNVTVYSYDKRASRDVFEQIRPGTGMSGGFPDSLQHVSNAVDRLESKVLVNDIQFF